VPPPMFTIRPVGPPVPVLPRLIIFRQGRPAPARSITAMPPPPPPAPALTNWHRSLDAAGTSDSDIAAVSAVAASTADRVLRPRR
jgi:hypothetical protein